MKTLYFIKDIRGNEIYWRYRIKEIKEATSFTSEEEALNIKRVSRSINFLNKIEP